MTHFIFNSEEQKIWFTARALTLPFKRLELVKHDLCLVFQHKYLNLVKSRYLSYLRYSVLFSGERSQFMHRTRKKHVTAVRTMILFSLKFILFVLSINSLIAYLFQTSLNILGCSSSKCIMI